MQASRHGVGLREVADAEGGDDGCDGEEPREELAETARQPVGQVVLRTTIDIAAGITGAEAHTQECLAVLRGHAGQARDPHPEQSARSSHTNRRGHAHDVAHTHGGSESGGQSLVLGDVTLAAVVVAVDQTVAKSNREIAELDTGQANSEEQPGAQQQRNE